MTIKALYPTVRPTLNLDFAKTKVLDPRITYTRASTATFVGSNGLIQTAASGAARFDHNPTTGESLGLLVEEARTNRVTYSEQFDNAGWAEFKKDPIRVKLVNRVISGIPLGRFGSPEEMVGPVLFLASDAASMVTGIAMPVDGGNLAMNPGGSIDW